MTTAARIRSASGTSHRRLPRVKGIRRHHGEVGQHRAPRKVAWPAPKSISGTRSRSAAHSAKADAVGLDHRVGQQLLAHRLELGLGRGPVAARRARARSPWCAARRATPAKPRLPSARSIASASGSSTPWRNETSTLAFKAASPRTAGSPPIWRTRCLCPRRSARGYCTISGPLRSRGPASGRMPSRRAISA